jgi:hypothetical protein
MSMNVRVMVVREGVHDLGYWEGDPPAIGDTVDIDGACVVEQRHWVHFTEVRLTARRSRASWMFNERWEQR